jgi:hypothetical protein
MQMRNIVTGMVDKTKNKVVTEIKKSTQKCFGCNHRPINKTCYYRNWQHEGRSAFAFRVFRKVHLLPTCKKPDFAYPEKEEYKEAYCKELGVTYSELFPSNRGGGKGGGRAKKVYKMLT